MALSTATCSTELVYAYLIGFNKYFLMTYMDIEWDWQSV